MVRPLPDDPYLSAHRTRGNVKRTDTVRVTVHDNDEHTQQHDPTSITTEEPHGTQDQHPEPQYNE